MSNKITRPNTCKSPKSCYHETMMKKTPTFEELIDWLGEARYNAYMNGEIPRTVHPTAEQVIKFVYGELPMASDVDEAMLAAAQRRRDWQ